MYLCVDCAGVNNSIHKNTKRFHLKIYIYIYSLLLLLLHCVWSVWQHLGRQQQNHPRLYANSCPLPGYRHSSEVQPFFGGTPAGDKNYQHEHHAAWKGIARQKRKTSSPTLEMCGLTKSRAVCQVTVCDTNGHWHAVFFQTGEEGELEKQRMETHNCCSYSKQ